MKIPPWSDNQGNKYIYAGDNDQHCGIKLFVYINDAVTIDNTNDNDKEKIMLTMTYPIGVVLNLSY